VLKLKPIFTLARPKQRTVKLVSPSHLLAYKFFHTTANQRGSSLTQVTSGFAELLRTSYSCISDYISALSLHCPVRGSNLGRGKSCFSSPKVQTGSGAHPASHLMVTGVTYTHLHPLSKLTFCGAIPLLHLYKFVEWTGKTLTLPPFTTLSL
jgi:hypothetical protein